MIGKFGAPRFGYSILSIIGTCQLVCRIWILSCQIFKKLHSDKKIEKLVDADLDYIAAVDKKLDYKNLVTTFTNILTGLDTKHDMLVQLSAKRNKEISGGVS